VIRTISSVAVPCAYKTPFGPSMSTVTMSCVAVHDAGTEYFTLVVSEPFGGKETATAIGSVTGQPGGGVPGRPALAGATNCPDQTSLACTAVSVQFWAVSVAVDDPPGVTADGLKAKLVISMTLGVGHAAA
jgi:hypothetical protein